MENVHISQLYPCSTIKLGSELYYICELAKYLKKENRQLTLEGILIQKELEKSEFWNYFVSKIKDGTIEGVNLKNLPSFIDVYGIQDIDLTDEQHEPVFTTKNDDIWLFDVRGNSSSDEAKNIKRLNGTLRSQSWVSLVAMVAVHSFMNNYKPKTLKLDFDKSVTYQNMAVSDILLLSDETEAFGDWVEITVDNELQSYYEAWFKKHYDKGYLHEFVDTKKKLEYMREHNYYEGCPVFLYQRETKREEDTVKGIKKCDIAIIRKITKDKIYLDVVSSKETRYMAYQRFESFSPEVKRLYAEHNNFDKVHVHKEDFDLFEIGVDMLMYMEEYFISDVNKDDMVVLTDVKDMDAVKENDGYLEEDPINVELTSQQAVYWVLKDWGVKFDEERYIKTFLKEGKAMYDIYKGK